MKLKANHLPEEKIADLDRITETIKEHIEVYMIILFGSYARGDYVEDIYRGVLLMSTKAITTF